MLKLSIKSNNVNVISSGLACLPNYFPILLPTPVDSTTTTSTPTHQQLTFYKKSLIDLLPFEKLGDSKEKIRELSKNSIISASVTILKFGNITSTTTSNGKENEGPWSYISRLLIESFTSKNIKIREQVSFPLNVTISLTSTDFYSLSSTVTLHSTSTSQSNNNDNSSTTATFHSFPTSFTIRFRSIN